MHCQLSPLMQSPQKASQKYKYVCLPISFLITLTDLSPVDLARMFAFQATCMAAMILNSATIKEIFRVYE